MQIQILDPVNNIKLYNFSSVVTQQHNDEICKVTDKLIDRGEYIKEDHPLYHITGDPFEDRLDEIWKVMKNTFHECCREYIGQPYKILSTQSRVTRMIYDPETDYTEMWHDHIQDDKLDGLSLSAIWYTNIPDELRQTGKAGTEFAFDWPNTDNTVFLGPYDFSWILFPNTLMHRPGVLHSSLPRYVMSADLQYMLL
jgi:hypothetical protein